MCYSFSLPDSVYILHAWVRSISDVNKPVVVNDMVLFIIYEITYNFMPLFCLF